MVLTWLAARATPTPALRPRSPPSSPTVVLQGELMKLQSSDPDIATISSRIESGDINLQPDFQRGEVWSETKKQRLIDSILRNWHVPPIHIIVIAETGTQEVLDGQQRLASIRDFMRGILTVDGTIEPADARIARLDGMTYHELPLAVRRKFGQFTISVFRVTDYAPEEPGELFYRLNQPVSLTAAEQRNAFFGPAREQVKDIVASLATHGIDKSFIGFTNSRMAYDDVIARLFYSLEIGTLREKVTSPMLASKYRSSRAFPRAATSRLSNAISLLGEARGFVRSAIRLNRATLFTWLWFIMHSPIATGGERASSTLGEFIEFFESTRYSRRQSESLSQDLWISSARLTPRFAEQLLEVYEDRSSSRVTDVAAVLSRDLVLWLFFAAYVTAAHLGFPHRKSVLDLVVRTTERKLHGEPKIDAEKFIEQFLSMHEWGRSR